jgi:hypothetical protein
MAAPLFSKRSLQVFLLVEFLLMLALITISTIRLGGPATRFLPVLIYVLTVPVACTIKMIMVLYETDDQEMPPKVREWLYGLPMWFPVVSGLLPLFLILRYAGAR